MRITDRMNRIAYWFGLISIAWVLLVAPAARAQSTYTAANCSQAAILAAYVAEQVSPADGDIIAVPTGNCTWTGNSSLVTRFSKSVTVQGAGAISATAGGASTIGTDNTVITDHFTGGASRWLLACAAGKTCRITGIAFYQDTSTASTNGGDFAIQAGSGGATWRVDHIHIKVKSGNQGIYVGGADSGSVTGVADHNFLEPAVGQTSGLTNTYSFHNGFGWNGGPTSDVNTSWASAPNFGSSGFFFVEDNYIHNSDVSDGSDGARYVIRHNNVVCDVTPVPVSQCQLFSHTTREGQRGDFAREIYDNRFTQPGGGNIVVPINSGVALVWGNTVTGFKGVANLDNQRQYSEDFQFTPIPSGLGYCGPAPYVRGTASVPANSTAVTGSGFSTNWTANGSNLLMIIAGATCSVNSPNAANASTCPIARVNSSSSITLSLASSTAATGGTYQVGSPWDGNTSVTGYPCLDQAGRAFGDLLSGQTNSNLLNTTTRTQTWPHQALTPIYVWRNTFTPTGNNEQLIQASLGNPSQYNFTNNVDYYVDFGTYGNSGNFNGTTGVGEGLLSARPSTCTAGTDPATGGSAPGAGYWATDTNTLYVCNPTNTWTSYYTPYTYPHPLTAGGTSGSNVTPPTGLSATVQ